MLKSDDGLLYEGEWDSLSVIPLECSNDGRKVCGGGNEQCLGGAEPLVSHRLLLAGHHDLTRPSGICSGLMKEEILNDIAGEGLKMMMKDDYSQMPGAEG